MTRYSASRGIRYTTPPGPEGEDTADESATATVDEDRATDGEDDRRRDRGHADD